jgi:TRAP-type C4-dicarboxylate transport system permease small subunit
LTSNRIRGLLFAALALAFVLRIDLWFWDDPSFVLGLPVGLTYHALFCVAVAGLMALVVRFAWNPQANDDSEQEAER